MSVHTLGMVSLLIHWVWSAFPYIGCGESVHILKFSFKTSNKVQLCPPARRAIQASIAPVTLETVGDSFSQLTFYYVIITISLVYNINFLC